MMTAFKMSARTTLLLAQHFLSLFLLLSHFGCVELRSVSQDGQTMEEGNNDQTIMDALSDTNRVRRALSCTGRPSSVNQICRWTGSQNLECACVNGTYCSIVTNICEVCEVSTPNCVSPCSYPCHNGGTCSWDTGRCQCPANFWGVDCSSRREPDLPKPDSTKADIPVTPSSVEQSILCGERPCLNGGQCREGICVCPTGYDFPDCSLCLPKRHPHKCLNHCRLECQRGDCLTVIQQCHCSVAYTGEDCNLCIPAKAHMNCTNICSSMCQNDATCNAETRKCECTSGWMGESCNQRCPYGTFGLNCRKKCSCSVGSCHPVSGECLCGPHDSPLNNPNCAPSCDCLVDGICYSQEKCPRGAEIPGNLPLSTQLPLQTTAAEILGNKDFASDGNKPMMIMVIATAAGAAFLMIIVVVLIVCLVRTRRRGNTTRKSSDRKEEAECVPMTGAVAGNTYDDVHTTPDPASCPQSQAPYRPTSGYEDIKDVHQNMPDLLQKHAEQSDISPYAATTGNVTVHADGTPSEYASVDELNEAEKSHDKLEGVYSSLQDEGSLYEDASSASLRPSLVNGSSTVASQAPIAPPGYTKMNPCLNNWKASSLKCPQDNIRFEIQPKSASLKLPRNATAPMKQPYENTYVKYKPTMSKENENGDLVAPPLVPKSSTKPEGEIPHYAKPNKSKVKKATDKQAVPHYAKSKKSKSIEAPLYAEPNKPPSGDSATNLYDQLERPLVRDKGKLPPSAGYAHLMHAVSPKQDDVNSTSL